MIGYRIHSPYRAPGMSATARCAPDPTERHKILVDNPTALLFG